MLTIRAAAWLLMAAWSLSFSGHRPRLQPAPPTGFALVEWFTSEGCSSCPPADALMARLLAENRSQVILLGYHVDYWNHLGWKDRFSSPVYSQRQRWYAGKLGLTTVYTPQAIVNGRVELVASRESDLRHEIDEALTIPAKAKINLSADPSGSDKLVVKAVVEGVREGQLLLALVQKSAAVQVEAGENEGSRLQHVQIVRELRSFSLAKQQQVEYLFSVPAGLEPGQLRVVGLVESRDSGVIGASQVSPASEKQAAN